MCLWSQILGRLRREDCLSLGGEGCSKPRLCHWTAARVTEPDTVSKGKKEKKERKREKKEEMGGSGDPS